MESGSSRVLPEEATAQAILYRRMIIKGFPGLFAPTLIHPLLLTQPGKASAVCITKNDSVPG